VQDQVPAEKAAMVKVEGEEAGAGGLRREEHRKPMAQEAWDSQ